ncbi:DNA repair protein RecN [Paenisporosarcina cavernae]|uniref:DNA repair protein RecN n=1 Tax=Paenisporosarcina cavernae TaxID=2320858 RepID=A0A385YSC8_9BACL|nr:DNA repair protein RecN [Paenisporosarcina cavernae]AYC29536.1 DNA repair protein RecN [Paenisporosarcina cavernae]
MLKELSVKNFAIIENLHVSFQTGMTVLSGETGAGKSIIIDAVTLLCGGRGSTEFIRHGAPKAELEGLFDVEDATIELKTILDDHGLEIEEELLILRRDIALSGKSICRINGKLVPLSILREIGSHLIDIHGQHESQELMEEKNHLPLLDSYGGEKIISLKNHYYVLYQRYTKLVSASKKATENEQVRAQKMDLYSFQLNEIDALQLVVGEDEKLAELRKQGVNHQKIVEKLANSYTSIQEEGHGLDWIGKAMSDMNEISDIHPTYAELAETISSAFYSLQDVSYAIKDAMDSLEINEEELIAADERLEAINQVKRKYGHTVEEVLDYRDRVEEKWLALKNHDENLQQSQLEIEKLEKDMQDISTELTIIRKKLALNLKSDIEEQLKDLYMEKATFTAHIESAEAFRKDGKDQISFYLSPNNGEPEKPVAKIASGGELSRIMLALKSIFSKHQGVTSIIFDEVDSGVSGRVAQAIAEKIAKISIGSQVLCISHLPQVAAMADHHYVIQKESVENRTVTSLKEVTSHKRVEEISRMMSGEKVTDTTLRHASELIEMAETRKNYLS